MKLKTAVLRYIAYKQGLGMKFIAGRYILTAFCRSVGDVDIGQVSRSEAWAFISPNGLQTRVSENKYYALCAFYRFAMSRELVSRSPLPTRMASLPQVMVPYIYSREEIARLIQLTAERYMLRTPHIEPGVIRMLILLLYGCGLRLGEAVGLTLADVDLKEQQICVRNTKFYKTRLVPLAPDLAQALAQYLNERNTRYATRSTSPVFVNEDGGKPTKQAIEYHFRCLCRRAGFGVPGGRPINPRLHDLRHSAVVHRVLAWYREGRDVQALLPKLSTYIGHKDVASTQRYLQLIPELLDEASQRFAAHARGVLSHA